MTKKDERLLIKMGRANFVLASRLIYIPFVTSLVFVLSYIIGPYHYEGDQVPYSEVYQALIGHSLLDSFGIYRTYLDSFEIVHFLVIWFGANSGIDKNLLMSISNALLANTILLLFRQWRVSAFVAVIFVLTNYYVMVMYFTTERLKFSFIFLALSLIYSRKFVRFIFFSTLSILAHAQNIIIYFCAFIAAIVTDSPAVRRAKEWWVIIFVTLIIIYIIFFDFGQGLFNHILTKVDVYSTNNTKSFFSDVIVLFSLMLISLYYENKKVVVVSLFLPLFPMLYLLGSDRLNMIAYCFFVYFVFRVKSGINLGVIITSAYLFVKSGYYLYYLFDTGNGFYYWR